MDREPLTGLMLLTQEEFSKRFRGSPIKRAKRRGFLRNVAVTLGNWGSPDATPALSVALNDDESLVRGHVAWALGRVAALNASSVEIVSTIAGLLVTRLALESDPWVRDEISAALTS